VVQFPLLSFSERCAACLDDPAALLVALRAEAHGMAEQLFTVWNDLATVLPQDQVYLSEMLQVG
jgi:hypothetical protein